MRLLCRMWKKAPKVEGIANVQLKTISQNNNVSFIRWKVHNDWVQQVNNTVTKMSSMYHILCHKIYI